jgi:hypothetical protein
MKIRKNGVDFNDYDIYLDDVKQDRGHIVVADDEENYIVFYLIIDSRPRFTRREGNVRLERIKPQSFEF